MDKNKLNISQLDIMITRSINAPELHIPQEGWVNAIRKALGMSKRQLAQRASITTLDVTKIEASEAAGTITLNALDLAARGLGCKVVHILVPDVGSFQKLRANQALQNINRDTRLESGPSRLRKSSRKHEKDLLTKWKNEFWNVT